MGRVLRHPLVWIALLVGVGARLALAAAFHGNFDEQSYEIVAAIMRRGGNVYTETTRYNYTPLWAYVLLGLDQLRVLTGLPLHLLVRSLLTAVDVANAALLAAIASRVGSVRPSLAFAAYLLNPVAVILVGYHGQFETLASLPLLLAALAPVERRRLPWVLGTTALIVKHITVFSVWSLFVNAYGHRRALPLAVLSAVAFALTFAPFVPGGGDAILLNVLGNAGKCCWYGIAAFMPRFVAFALFAGIMTALPLLLPERLLSPRIAAFRLAAVALLAVIPGFADQYLLLPVVFGAWAPGYAYWAYSAVATLFLIASPDNVGAFPPLEPWLAQLAWLCACAWAIALLRTHPVPRVAVAT